MKLELLDDYSRAFANRLCNELTQYKNYITIKSDYEDELHLDMRIPCPSDESDCLFVATDEQEIIVGFSHYHTHFGYNENREADFSEAIEFINNIIDEKIIIIVGSYNKEDWNTSSWIEPKEIPSIKEKYSEYKTIQLKSWNGTYDRITISL